MKPLHCRHLLYPNCGCQHPPAVATHLIVERDREAAIEKAKPKKGGRPKTPWATPRADPADQFLATLPKLVEDPHARANLLKLVDAALARQSFSEFCKQAWHVVESSTKLSWSWHHSLICDVMQGIMEDWERGQDDDTFVQRVVNVIFSVPPGSLKPVCVKGLVNEKTRGLVPLSTIQVGDQILTHKGRFRNVLAVSEQGQLPVIEFTTGRGRKIKAAGDHPFLTQRGWVRADEVTIHDVFAEVHSEENSGSATITPEDARMVGYIIGDGCISGKDAVSFTNQDPESLEDFKNCVESVGLTSTSVARSPSYKGGGTHVVYVKGSRSPSCVECSGELFRSSRCKDCFQKRYKTPKDERVEFESHLTDVRKWVVRHGLSGAKSGNKRVPTSIMQGDRETILNYLSAYWSCDGTIQDRRDIPRAGRTGQKTNSVRVSSTTISEGLARDHQHLLQRLGLSFRVRRKATNLTKAMISRKSNDRLGEEYISWDVVASDQDTAAKFMQVVGPYMRHEKRTRAQNLARTRFDQVLNADEVVAIEVSEPTECRCLQVEEDSSFSYQGVAVHNSRLLSCFLPVWMWLRRPGWKLIALSVNEDSAMRDARASRDLIRSDWFQNTFSPDWQLNGDQLAISNYANTKGGVRISKAQGSVIVGQRGDAIFCDDPNDPNEAESKLVREKVNELYTTNIHNRVNDPDRSVRIGIQQRVHNDDWTGYVTKRDGVWTEEDPNPFKWLHVVLPAEFEPERRCRTPWGSDPRTSIGEVLHPKRMTAAFLEAEKKRFGSARYAGQLQQRPMAAGGGVVKMKWFRFFNYLGQTPISPGERSKDLEEVDRSYHSLEITKKHGYEPRTWDFDWTVITLDCAAKSTEKGSQHGILVISGKGPQRFVRDNRTMRGDILEVLSIVTELCQKYDPDRILIEAKAAGPALMSLFTDRFQRGKITGSDGRALAVVVDSIEPTGDKTARLSACLPELESGLVYLHDGAQWLVPFCDEVCGYPFYGTDDIPDALSQGLNHMRSYGVYTLPDW